MNELAVAKDESSSKPFAKSPEQSSTPLPALPDSGHSPLAALSGSGKNPTVDSKAQPEPVDPNRPLRFDFFRSYNHSKPEWPIIDHHEKPLEAARQRFVSVQFRVNSHLESETVIDVLAKEDMRIYWTDWVQQAINDLKDHPNLAKFKEDCDKYSSLLQRSIDDAEEKIVASHQPSPANEPVAFYMIKNSDSDWHVINYHKDPLGAAQQRFLTLQDRAQRYSGSPRSRNIAVDDIRIYWTDWVAQVLNDLGKDTAHQKLAEFTARCAEYSAALQSIIEPEKQVPNSALPTDYSHQ